jgi:hypothetical protein
VARIRTIKPSFWSDERVVVLPLSARLLLIGIISCADDAGRFIAAPVALSGTVFPLDDIKPTLVKRWRDEIAATGIVELYQVNGREYGYFPQWRKHQRIDRPQPSSLPGPSNRSTPPEPPDDERFVERFDDPFDESLGNSACGDRKGREGIGSKTPQPPASGGRSCTRHARHRRGCSACETPANPTVQLGPPCGACSPARRLEGADGADLGPCPTCHPARRPA